MSNPQFYVSGKRLMVETLEQASVEQDEYQLCANCFMGRTPAATPEYQRYPSADLMFSLMFTGTSCWTNIRTDGNLRRHDVNFTSIWCTFVYKFTMSESSVHIAVMLDIHYTVETLYSTIYYSKYFIELNLDKSTQYVALWTHKRHPIPRPFGRAMECLLWVFQQKLTVL